MSSTASAAAQDDGIAAEGAAVVAGREQLAGRADGEAGADRQAAAEALGQGDDVGAHALGLAGERTRRGLEAARSRGGTQSRTAVADVPELQDRIARMRADGMTLQAIADVLNEEGVPTLRGGAMWRPSSVQRATGYRRPTAGGRGIELPKFNSPPR